MARGELVLGIEPLDLAVILVKDADFNVIVQNSQGAWSSTSLLYLIFETSGGPVTWSATRSGNEFTFSEDVVDVNAVASAVSGKARLFYEDGPFKTLWAIGSVEIDG